MKKPARFIRYIAEKKRRRFIARVPHVTLLFKNRDAEGINEVSMFSIPKSEFEEKNIKSSKEVAVFASENPFADEWTELPISL